MPLHGVISATASACPAAQAIWRGKRVGRTVTTAFSKRSPKPGSTLSSEFSLATVRDAGGSSRTDPQSVWDNGLRYPVPDSMLTKDSFRVFQEELAALEKQDRKPEGNRMEKAKAEFLALKRRYGLTVADVVTFFPEEEGIAYLETLIAKPVKPQKKKAR
jgi:hypothetical protein